MNNEFHYYIENFPLNIHWMGWKTTTRDLQRFGWQLSAEQDAYNFGSMGAIRLAMKHPNQDIYGITNPTRINIFNSIAEQFEILSKHVIGLEYMCNRVVVKTTDDFNAFYPVDGTPIEREGERKRLEDFNIFRPLAKTNEIIIDSKDVNKVMDIILNLQDSKQKEIRYKKRKEWERFQKAFNNGDLNENMQPRTEVIAQFITT